MTLGQLERKLDSCVRFRESWAPDAVNVHRGDGCNAVEGYKGWVGKYQYLSLGSKDTASYQRDVYRITQPLGAFFFISHTVLSLVERKGKWKWRMAQLMSHGMRGSF